MSGNDERGLRDLIGEGWAMGCYWTLLAAVLLVGLTLWSLTR